MSWDTKRPGGPTYYYRSVREADGKVRKVYVGRGPAAERQARQDERARVLRLAACAARVAAREKFDAAMAATVALSDVATLLIQGTMLVAGLRYHRGEWRRPRNCQGGRNEHDRC
jgi:hypothetical protein